jgi:hypothetical protein
MFKPIRQLSIIIAVFALSTVLGARAAVKLESDMTHEKSASPGETYRGTLVLRNTAEIPAQVKVYQTDYSFAADGSSEYGEPGRLPRTNAKWISLSRELVTVPPQGVERVDYDVKVPTGGGAGFSGTYWSMIMVEPLASDSAEASEPLPERTTRITQVMRYGVQVVTHIGKTGEPDLAFSNPQVVKEDGIRRFAIDAENTGQRWLRTSLWLELFSETGNPIGKFQGNPRRLYPGTSARFQIDLGGVPAGKYLGLVVADGTGDNLFGANVELEIE